MIRLSKPLLFAGLLFILLAPVERARADDGCDGGCGGCGGGCHKARLGGHFHHTEYEPSVTWYAPYPYWWPNYFYGPPRTDYAPVQYVTPPAESALIVKERILAINSTNPALIPPAKEPLPFPDRDKKELPGKLP
jgi:hypothetical protein